MQKTSFTVRLLYLTVPLVIITLILQFLYPPFAPYAPVTWMSIIFFTVFSWAAYQFGAKATASDNKNDFIRSVMMIIMGKLFLSIFLVVGYVYAVQPANRLVVLPFIPIYIVYTVFETKALMELARKKTA